MNKKCYIEPKITLVRMDSEAILDTHVSGTDLPDTGMGGDTDDSGITPEAKEVNWDNEDFGLPWE